ncbi:MAG: hypothetical protein QGH42_10685 [Kiritimatiellia bacterium]|jgi:uncharacterized membrane protein|nr:hypothetical protein [Pseudomonadales bacterium]MDP6469398.1 hypothetical protein [Pseudomonadales bacterium]MDP6828983.1 hypothetical protein [Pseudomonadales bacterium]MDP7024689.1 hypothetical protein [Kiritimatiellia bacterium]|tara:strand:+ start:449 stop:982 length:534 start_codon:yes stop_codon:yes gene_type:complete
MKFAFLFSSFIHDLAVATYVGGAVAMEFILGPAQRAIPPAQAQVMGEKTAERFLLLVWISLVLIFLTGVWRLYLRGYIGGDALFNAPLTLEFAYGRTAFALFLVWLILVINGALITFVFRPRLTSRMSAGVSQTQAQGSRDSMMAAVQWIEWLTRIDLVLALLAVLLGASLIWGGLF